VQAMYVRLPADGREALCRFAEKNWRDPRDQAALLVLDGLRRAGMLPPEPEASASLVEAPE
jgi:hypothetical protein